MEQHFVQIKEAITSISDRPDAHARPPEPLRLLFKQFQKLSIDSLNTHEDLLDCGKELQHGQTERLVSREMPVSSHDLETIYSQFLGGPDQIPTSHEHDPLGRVYKVANLPGRKLSHDLRKGTVAAKWISAVLRTFVNDPSHNTNVHLHYDVPYPASSSAAAEIDADAQGDYNSSFFHPSSLELPFAPKDRDMHNPITVQQFLNKKLRWMTLGGQYDWTAKAYPVSPPPPPFPPEIKRLVQSLFPRMKAEAAIVNLYSPGDTLSLHRDVSEDCARPLVSVSLGCEGIFVVGGGNGEGVAIRLRSGDAVVMEGDVRYAWHGVPRVLEGTCPKWMRSWPANDEDDGRREEAYEEWRGWMQGKRVNLNVRQMFA